jgi:hypothetical protein
MANNIFGAIDIAIKGIIYFCLLLVAAVASVFLLYFVALTGWRLFWLCWESLFSHAWRF